MGYSKHVGRVGALAVALGIGTAVTAWPAVAFAEPTDSSSSSSPDGASQSSQGTTQTSDAPAADDPGSGTVQASSGATRPKTRATSTTSADVPAKHRAKSKQRLDKPKTKPRSGAPSAGSSDKPSTRSHKASEETPDASPAAHVDVQPPIAARVATRARHQLKPTTAVVAAAVPDASPPDVLTGIATSLAGLFNPFDAKGQGKSVDSPLSWAMLAWTRRQSSGSTLDVTPPAAALRAAVSVTADVTNHGPVAGTPTVAAADPVTGAVTGSLNVTDPDGDPLTYTVTTNPAKGTVAVLGDGTFTYTPTGRARLDAFLTPGSDVDSFAVTATDGAGGSTSVAVNAVPISPAEAAVTATLNISSAHGVAISPDSTRAYVASLDGTVSVVDTSTGAVIATINVGGGPRYPAITPDGAHVYVANQYPGNVAVIDTATNTVTSTINVGEGAFDVAITRDGSRAYVTNVNTGTLSVIDTASNTVTNTIYVSPDVRAVALSPDGTRAYVTDPRRGLVVVDTTTDTVIDTIYSGSLQYVTVSPDGAHAYVTKFNNYVSVIDTSTDSDVSLIDVGLYPNGIAISRDGSRLYLTTVGDNSVKVIDTSTNTVVGTVPVGNFPIDIAVSSNGAFAYVTNTGAGTVSVITFANSAAMANHAPVAGTPTYSAPDPTNGSVTGSLNFTDLDGEALTYTSTVDSAKGSLIVRPDGTFTFTPTEAARLRSATIPGHDVATISVTASDGNATAVTTFTAEIDPAKFVAGQRIQVGDEPINIVASPDGTKAYVSNGGTMVVVDTVTNTVIGDPIYTGGATVIPSPDGTRLYLIHEYRNSLGQTPGYVTTLDAATYSTIDAASAPTSATPVGVGSGAAVLSITATGSRAYMLGPGAAVTVIDLATNQVVGDAISFGGFPSSLTIDADGSHVYVTNINTASVSVIDTATDTLVGDPIPVAAAPRDAAFSPDGKRLYVVSEAGRLTVVDLSTAQPTTQTVQFGDVYTFSLNIALSPDGSLAYVSSPFHDTVYVFDTATLEVLDASQIGRIPGGNYSQYGGHFGMHAIAVLPDGRVLVPKRYDDAVAQLTLVPRGNAAPVIVADARDADDVESTGAVDITVTVSDLDLDEVSVTVGNPTKGRLDLIDADGGSYRYVYTPTPEARHAAGAADATYADYVDGFTVTAIDSRGATTTQDVGFYLTPLNALPAPATTTAAVNLSTGVAAGRVTFVDADGDTLTYSGTTDTPKGRLEVNLDGTFAYTPTVAARHAAAAAGASDEDRTDVVTVTADDGHGGVVSVQLGMVITPQNSAPTVTFTQVGATNASTGAVTYAANGTDPDGDALSYTVTANPTKGALVINGDGTYTYTPSAAARHPAASDTATLAQRQDSFTVTADDAHGGTTVATATVTIAPKNAAPTVTLTQMGSPNSTTGAITYQLTGSDADGDPLTYTVTNPTKGTLVRNTNGTYTYTPTAAARHDAALANATPAQRQDTVTITASDAHGGATAATATAIISPKNAAPKVTLTQIGAANTTTGAVTYQINGSDPDGDALTYSVTTGPANGVAVVNADGTLTCTPTDAARHAASAAGATTAQKQDTFTVSANDAHGGAATATARVTISSRNAAPTIAVSQVGADASNGSITYAVSGTDTDGDALVYTVTTNPSKGTLVRNTDGTYTFTPTDAARHSASATNASTATKQDAFTISANDAHGGAVNGTARVTISPRNAAPTITVSQVSTDASTGSITYAINGTDSDGDQLTYTVATKPNKGTIVRNTDGTYTYTPTAAARHAASADTATPAQRQDTLTLNVTDAHGGSAVATITSAISSKNTSPSVTLTQVGSANTSTGAITYRAGGSDPDGDALTYTVTANPTRGTVVNNANGTFTYTPTAAARHDAALTTATAAQRQDTFTITANDAHGATTTATANVTISPKNTGPTSSPTVGSPNTAGVVTGSVGASDPDGDSLGFVVTTNPGKGTVTVRPDGAFTYTPTAEAQHAASADNATTAQKRDTFVVAVTDGHGGTQNVTITTQVAPKNAGPRATPTATNTSLSTGSVSGSIGGSDQDNDSLVYAVTSKPTKGTVTVNPDGTLSYTPTAAARTAASKPTATPAQKQDSFSVSVKDGHGGTTVVTYTVPLSATSSGSVVIVVNPAQSTSV